MPISSAMFAPRSVCGDLKTAARPGQVFMLTRLPQLSLDFNKDQIF
jgi:hypothetical protein